MKKSQSAKHLASRQGPAEQTINWAEVEAKFSQLTTLLEPFEIVSDDELAELKLSDLTFGLYKCPTARKRDLGVCLLHEVGDEARRVRLNVIAHELGCSDRKDRLPPPIKASLSKPLEVVAAAIKSKVMSQEFLFAWGRLHELAVFFSIEMTSRQADQAVDGMMSQSIEIQRYWYAHWLRQNARSFSPKDRERAAESLRDVCLGVARGRLSPTRPYARPS